MTPGVWYRARAQILSGIRGLVVLVLLVGVSSGVVLASAAGARRTSTAFDRMVAVTNAPEVLVSPNGDGTGMTGFYDEIASIPGVREVGVLRGIPLMFTAGDHAGSMVAGATVAPVDHRFAVTVGAPKVLDGRMWDPQAEDELVVNRFFAETYGVSVGDRISFEIPSFDGSAPAVPAVLDIVGVVVTAQEVIPFTDLDGLPAGLLSPAIVSRLSEAHNGFEGAAIDLDDPRRAAEVTEVISSLAQKHGDEFPEGVFTVDLASNVEQVKHSIRPLTVALAMFAAVLAAVVVIVVGQSIRRHVRPSRADVTSLDALGFRRSERRQVLVVRGAMLGAAAAVVSLGTAIVMSPMFPVGPARVAEPDEGLAADLTILLPGAVAVALFCVVAAATAGDGRAIDDVRLPASLANLKLSPAASAGLRAAWPRGSGGAGAVAATVAGVVAVLAAATFGASLSDLVDRPLRYGQSWDVMVDGQFGPAPLGLVMERVGADPGVTAIAAGNYGEAVIGRERVPAISWSTLRGDLDLVAVDGRTATDHDEIALGGETLDRLGLTIGDSVDVDLGDGARSLRIVGEVVFPRLGLGSFGATGLGVGAQLHTDAMPPLSVPPSEGELAAAFVHDGALRNFVAIDVADEARSDIQATLNEVAEVGTEMFGEAFPIRTTQRPTTIADLDRVRAVPVILALALAVLAAATLGHSLASSLRRRRRELAIMSSLGFERRQLAATVTWHAAAVGIFAVVCATPVGAAAGRTAWRAFADQFYVPADPVTPMPAFALVAVATVAVAVVIAAPFAIGAARTRPALVLRAE
ncbi:MAG TPA: FtsX-like permease family protein [Acidimicrobiales bacterium]|nr:FtsX-like permease family protein [Acidimicrobiales bacterium]